MRGTPNGMTALQSSSPLSPLAAPSTPERGRPLSSGASHPAPAHGELAICLLYVFFFLIWSAGLILGVRQDAPTMLFGLPLWFSVSCVLAFAAACGLLAALVQRYFR